MRRNLFRDSVRSPWCKLEKKPGVGMGWISDGGKVDRCQMPCSQWDARRPGSEDVRVIGPLLRFRLLRPRGTRFGGLTEPVLSLQWKRPSWCRRGATDYRLACRSPSSRPYPARRPLSLLAAQRLAITLYSVHVLPAVHNKTVLLLDAPRSVAAVVAVDDDTSNFSEATNQLSRPRTWQVVIEKWQWS